MNAFTYFMFLVGINCLLGRLLGMFLPIYFQEIGLSGIATGVYFSITSVAMIVFSLPMGVSTDRHSVRLILALSFLLIGLGYVGFLISHALWVFCLFAMVGSFGGRFYGIASSTMFFKITGPDNLREAALFQSFTMVATATGMLIGGYLIAGYSFKLVFILTIVGNVLLAGVSFLLPRTETVVISLEEYRRTVLEPRVLFLTLIFFLFSVHWGAEMVSYALFLKEKLRLGTLGIAWYTSLGFVMVGVGALAGYLVMRWGWVKNYMTLLSLGFLLSGGFHILMCVPHVYWSFGFRLAHEVGDGLISLIYYHGISRTFHVNRIGGCASFISLWTAIGSCGSAILFGYVNDLAGPAWPLIISGTIMVLPVLLKMKRWEVAVAGRAV